MIITNYGRRLSRRCYDRPVKTMADDFEYQLRSQEQYGQVKVSSGTESGQTYVDPTDGTVYVWDDSRQGWFPKVDDDFLAAYQASYGLPGSESVAAAPNGGGGANIGAASLEKDSSGFLVPPMPSSKSAPTAQGGAKPQVSTTSVEKASEAVPDLKRPLLEDSSEQQEDPKRKKPNAKETPQWFEIDDEKNQNVYVSGLPADVTVEEFTELMKKCGIIAENDDGDLKVKLYKGSDGNVKGDGLCCYLKKESIVLAIQLLDGSQVRGHTISVERAKFELKGQYNPALKKKKKKKKKGNKQERLLDWRERRKADGPIRKKNERIIVFKNVFDPKEFDEDPTLITDIKSDLNEECGNFGTVKKILIFDRHPEGIASVAFAEFEAADLCITRMDQRWYAEETDMEREERLQKWENFISGGDDIQETSDDTKKDSVEEEERNEEEVAERELNAEEDSADRGDIEEATSGASGDTITSDK